MISIILDQSSSVFSWSTLSLLLVLYRDGNNVDIPLLKGDIVLVSLLLRLGTREVCDGSLEARAARAEAATSFDMHMCS